MKIVLLTCFAAIAFAGGDADLNGDGIITRQEMVDAINAIEGLEWFASVPEKFADKPVGASTELLGVPLDYADILDKAIKDGEVQEVFADENFVAPDDFDSETNWPQCAKIIGDIRDQSNCGCCWAFGPASAASDRLCIATNGTQAMTLSAKELCFCSNPNGCGGGMPHAAYSYIGSRGLVSGGQYKNQEGPLQDLCSAFDLPHCHHHGPQRDDPYPPEGSPGCPSQRSPQCPTQCDSTAKAPHNVFSKDKYAYHGSVQGYRNEAAIQQTLMTKGPVATAFTVYSDFENYAGGIYSHTTGSVLGGHAVRFVGWGVDNGTPYWKVANSWNPYWGEKGYFRIKRGSNQCGIESQAVSSSDDAQWSWPQ
jgi:cathepsin B